jgi:hypothetical protein
LGSIPSPWHAKATYQVMNDAGTMADSGTFEAFWVSRNKYWIRYTSPHFNQTSIANEQGLYRLGDEGTPKGPGSLVRTKLFTMGYAAPRDPSKVSLKLEDRSFGSLTLKCVEGDFKDMNCFNHDFPVLRLTVSSHGYLETIYDEVVLFKTAYVAKSFEVRNGRGRILQVHIETLESYSPKDDTLFTAPPGAVFSPRRVTESGSIIAGNIVHKVQPIYPIQAKEQRVQGEVVLHAVISTEGKITSLEPILGPAVLISSSMDAVKQWQYRPYLIDGVPTEVETEIDVIFALSTGPSTAIFSR